VPGFVDYKKGCTRLAAASDKVYQLFVGGLMSYLRYFRLLAYSDVQHILRCVCVFCLGLVYPVLPVCNTDEMQLRIMM
jgi:hypothetical protein